MGASLAAIATAAAAVFGISQLADGTSTNTALPSSEPSVTQTPTDPPSPAPTTTQPTQEPSSTSISMETKPLLAPGDTGDKVRELQSRLKQIDWYQPKINGEFDDVTEESVQGFQAKREFKATGLVDKKTWNKLVDMTREPTDDEMHNRLTPGTTIIGPGSTEDTVRELQARLKQIGWFNEDVTGTYGDVTATAVSGFQVKRGYPDTGEVDQRTWDKIVEMTQTPTDDELFNRPAEDAPDGIDPRCMTGRSLCIDKSANALRWIVDGDVLMTFDVRFGCVGTPTREGAFSVYWKSREHVSSLYDSEMPFAMFFDGGQAVHYSSDFAAVGYSGCSHGCVNVRDYDGIAALFDQVVVGDKVIVYFS